MSPAHTHKAEEEKKMAGRVRRLGKRIGWVQVEVVRMLKSHSRVLTFLAKDKNFSDVLPDSNESSRR